LIRAAHDSSTCLITRASNGLAGEESYRCCVGGRSSATFGFAIFAKELLATCRIIYAIFFARAHGNAPADFGLVFASSSSKIDLTTSKGE